MRRKNTYENDIYIPNLESQDMFMEIKEEIPSFEKRGQLKRKMGSPNIKLLKHSRSVRDVNPYKCRSDDHKNSSIKIIEFKGTEFCFSDFIIKSFLSQPWIKKTEINNNTSNHYYYLEPLNIWVENNFREIVKSHHEFSLEFKGKENLRNLNELDTLFFNCVVYKIVPKSAFIQHSNVKQTDDTVVMSGKLSLKSKRKEMDDITNLFLNMNIATGINDIDEKNYDELSDLLQEIEIKNQRYSCNETNTSEENVFIFNILLDKKHYCLNINEVIYMIENFLILKGSVPKEKIDFVNVEERFYKLPFDDIFLDYNFIRNLEKKKNAFDLEFSGSRRSLSSVSKDYSNAEIYSCKPTNELEIGERNFTNDKFKGEVLLKKEIEKYNDGSYSINYRNSKWLKYRNDLPDELLYDKDNHLVHARWHQNNSRNKLRNGSSNLPGEIQYKNNKIVKQTFYDDNEKPHSSNNEPSVITYSLVKNGSMSYLSKKDYHTHGELVKTINYNIDTGDVSSVHYFKDGKLID